MSIVLMPLFTKNGGELIYRGGTGRALHGDVFP